MQGKFPTHYTIALVPISFILVSQGEVGVTPNNSWPDCAVWGFKFGPHGAGGHQGYPSAQRGHAWYLEMKLDLPMQGMHSSQISRMLALYVAILGSPPGILYGPLSTGRSHSWVQSQK